MKKILTILAFISYLSFFSQVVVTANFPSKMDSESSIEAEIKINKGTIGNFAKYQLDVPAGFVVSAIDSKDGNFTFENQRAKIVWVSIPSEPEFTIKLRVKANKDATNPGTFLQKFYYLENNEKKEVEVTPVTINIGEINSVASSTGSKPVSQTALTESKPVTKTDSAEIKPVETTPVNTSSETKSLSINNQTENKPVENKTLASKTTETPVKREALNSETGMTYKVQIGAYSTQPNKNKFSGLGNLNIDLINGLYKVTVGNFKTLDDAVKHRDNLKAKGYNGFIAKYKDGVRIN